MPVTLLVWNMEWMNDLFGPNDQPPAWRPDNHVPQHAPGTTVRERRDDLAGVLNDLHPDIVVVVEGPNRSGELQLLFDDDVNGDWSVICRGSLQARRCVQATVCSAVTERI